MTCGTVLGRRLVEENRLLGHHFHQFVTFGAAHVLVRSPKRKIGPLVMVERRRLPLDAVVAVGAARDIGFRELLAVDVLMAILALRGSSLEIRIDQLGLKVRRLMAIDAGRRLMGSEQREFCLRVVEPRHFFPRFGGVTSLAARRGTIRALLLHALFELALVNIFVATGAVEILPVVER